MVITPSPKPDRTNGSDSIELAPGPRPERSLSAVGKRLNVVEHPIAQHALTVLRDKKAEPQGLRAASNQLLTVLTFEITRILITQELRVDVPGGTYSGQVMSKAVVFVSLSRPGLGLSHGIADFVPHVSIGSVTLDHASSAGRLEPRLHLTNAPALNDSKVILFDPVVASGISTGIALNLLRKLGATDLALLNFVISLPGLKRIQATTPETTIWTAAVDEELDPKRGPIPGIGNLGQRLYSV